MPDFRAQSACIALMLAALAPLLSGCKEPAANAAAATPEVDVSVVVVQPRARAQVRELPGRIAPTRVADVRPRVSGIIVERLFNQGSEVKAGDPQSSYALIPKGEDLEVVLRLAGGRAPFNDQTCALVEEFRPRVVSFHFGLPERRLFERVKKAGAVVIASATTVAEARWLEERGVDAVIAQGAEAGGHRGIFLSDDVSSQPGTFALVPQIVDAVRVPVIAAGGIGDGRGIVAALALGAAGVQIGTAYLLTPESTISPLYRAALKAAREDQTVVTNVFTGRPARGIVNRAIRELGPLSAEAPAFPNAANAMLPLRQKAEAAGSTDFTSLWSGQAPRFAREIPAGEFTRMLVEDAQRRLKN